MLGLAGTEFLNIPKIAMDSSSEVDSTEELGGRTEQQQIQYFFPCKKQVHLFYIMRQQNRWVRIIAGCVWVCTFSTDSVKVKIK